MKSKDEIPLPGYVPMNRLLEINRDALRATPNRNKKIVCKALVIEIIKWSSYTTEEAIGLLESIQFHFLTSVEDISERDETATVQPKKIARRII